MKLSRFPVPTLREAPSDAVVSSHILMIRAGLVRKESAGMYIYLPFGFKALKKISEIVREEMNAAGAVEFLMPELTSADLWKESGRWSTMGPEMFRIKDRNQLEYALGPTHEEAFTNTIRMMVSSYKDLPINAYQINTKFRDEIRPRYGVIRSKEFIMKDAYSFDIDEDGLNASYESMRAAYRNIFDRCGLATIPVQADTGNMGGSASEEFMVASEVGEETLLLCGKCGYRANQEKAQYKIKMTKSADAPAAMEKVHTPEVKTIDELVKFFGADAHRFLKTLVYEADGKAVIAVCTGDRDINEVKLKNVLGCAELNLASDSLVTETTKAPVGFAGPVGQRARMIFDNACLLVVNGITGANEKDHHYTGVNPGRDFTINESADITLAVDGDHCPECAHTMSTTKGIEVGHIFKLGYKYTKVMNVTVLDKNGKAVNPIMGCYGIGVTRTLAAVVEQHHDEKGLIWPKSVAPFDIHLVGIGKTEEEIAKIESVYVNLKKLGYDVLYDDRKASPGVKFADADLLGLPLRITVGKSYFEKGEIEALDRKTSDMIKLASNEIEGFLKKFFNK